MSAPASPGFVIVSRYTRPDGRVIVNVYGGPDGCYSTRSKARTAQERQMREVASDARYHPDVVEFYIKRVIAL